METTSGAKPDRQLAQLICDFCFETILGHESGMYEEYEMQNQPFETLCANMDSAIRDYTMEYLNKVYKSLILKNDKHIQDKFDAMCKISILTPVKKNFTKKKKKSNLKPISKPHSAICLLKIIAVFIIDTHMDLDRGKFDITADHEEYMLSIMEQLNVIISPSLDTLVERITHICEDDDISKYNANVPLFS